MLLARSIGLSALHCLEVLYFVVEEIEHGLPLEAFVADHRFLEVVRHKKEGLCLMYMASVLCLFHEFVRCIFHFRYLSILDLLF